MDFSYSFGVFCVAGFLSLDVFMIHSRSYYLQFVKARLTWANRRIQEFDDDIGAFLNSNPRPYDLVVFCKWEFPTIAKLFPQAPVGNFSLVVSLSPP